MTPKAAKITTKKNRNKIRMRFGITGNINKNDLKKTLGELISFLIKEKIVFSIDSAIKDKVTNKAHKKFCLPMSKVLANSDVIISLGGDGTFLNTAFVVGDREIPVLGVNMGTLGFMSEIVPSEMKKFIKQILKGKYIIKNRLVLSAELPDGKTMHGINEIVVDRAFSVRMMEIEIFYNDEKIVRFVGDGAIISTPTGSTGYSLSAGGPVISMDSSDFIITPICPHTLNVRPIIVPDSGVIKLKVHREIEARVTADGQRFKSFKSPVEFTFKKAGHIVKVIHKPNFSYFKTLNEKLLWGKDLRKYK